MGSFSARHRRGLAVAGSCTVAGLPAYLYSATLPALGLAIFFAGTLLPARLGLLRRLVLGAAVYEVSLVAAATLLAPTGWAVHPRVLATLLLVAAAALAGFRGDWSLRPYFAAGDAMAAVLASLAFVVLAVPALTTTDGALVERLSFGTDNASHLNIIRAVQTTQRFVYHEPPYGLSMGGETYPQGLAFTAGYTTWLVRGGSTAPPVASLLRDTAYVWAMMFASMVLFGILLLRELLSHRVPAHHLQRASLTAGVFLTAFVVVGPGILLEAYGFQTQILAMGAILALLWVAVASELLDHPTIVLALMALLAMVVGHSWYLLLPVPCVVLAAFALKHRQCIGRPGWVAAGSLLVLAAYPILNGPGAGQAAAEGAVIHLPILAIAPLALSVIVLAAWWRPGLDLKNAGYTFLAAAASGALCLALAAQQLMTHGSLTYYFWKSVYLLGLLLAVLAVLAVAGVLASGRPRAAWTLPALTMVAWLATVYPAGYYAFGHRNGPADGAVVSAAMAAYPHGVPIGTFIAGQRCDSAGSSHAKAVRTETLHTSWWLNHLLMAWTPERLAVQQLEDSGTPDQLMGYAKAHPELNIVSYIQDECAATPALEPRWPGNLTITTVSP